jgi:hypothetical protein
MHGPPGKGDSPLGYFVSVQDWPAEPENGLSDEDLLETLNKMPDYYAAAMASLATASDTDTSASGSTS